MLFEGRMGVVSGRYHSVDGLNGSRSPSTVLELFGRTEHGESICALVHGLRPTFEISPLMVWSEGMEVPDGSLVLGSPGKIKGELNEDQRQGLILSAKHYVENSKRFQKELELMEI